MHRQDPWKLFAVTLFGAWTLVACSKNTGGDGAPASSGPTPAHPAMRIAPTSSSSRAGSTPTGSLPHGHPPIEGRPPVQRRPTTSRGGVSASPREVAAQLARLGVGVTFPEGWKLEGRSGMRLATVRLPRAEGDPDDGEMSIISASGSVEDNIRRWEGQFKEKPSAQVSTRTVEGGLEVTVTEMEGTFTSGGPMMSGGAAQPDTKLLGAIVQKAGAREMVFFKAWGPTATMEKWRASFEVFVDSIRVPK